MKRSTLIFSLMMAGLVGCADKGGDDTGSSGDATAGATVFTDVCVACHGASGEGIEGYSPSMTEEVPEKTDAELESIILDGYDEMPAQSLTATEVADVIAYLRATFDS